MAITTEDSMIKQPEEKRWKSHIQLLSPKAQRNLERFKRDKTRNTEKLRGKDPLINYILEELI